MRFGSITPTDVDGFVEFRDQLFVLIETKVEGQELPDGQRKALERECDAVRETGRMSTVLVVEHDTPPDKDIDVAACAVREYRYEGHWHTPIKPTTCKQAIDIFLDKAHIVM